MPLPEDFREPELPNGGGVYSLSPEAAATGPVSPIAVSKGGAMPNVSMVEHELLKQMQDLYAVRELFVQFGQVLPTVRPVVWDSWRRCQEYGIDPHKAKVQTPNPDRLDHVRRANRQLFAAAEPILQAANNALSDLPHMLVLLDRDAVLLRLLTDPVAARIASAGSNLFEGASWAEKDLGCNGGGTSLAVGEPVILIGPEHLVEDYIGWTCIGVPIRASDGSVIGAVDLSVPNERIRVHTWGWILRVTRAVEEAVAGRRLGGEAVESLGEIDNPLHAAHGVLRLLVQQIELTPLQKYFIEQASAQIEQAEQRYQGEEAGRRLQAAAEQLHLAVQRFMDAQARQTMH